MGRKAQIASRLLRGEAARYAGKVHESLSIGVHGAFSFSEGLPFAARLCHLNPPTVDVSPGPLPQKHHVPDTASVRPPEQLKAYPVGRYEDPNDPDVMHEGHTVYRAETSPDWNTDPNTPTSLPLGPGEMATADPAQQHSALTAELEQRLKQEDQLLQTTYEQNERLAQEIKTLQANQQHVLLPVPPSRTSRGGTPTEAADRCTLSATAGKPDFSPTEVLALLALAHLTSTNQQNQIKV